jgi:hypothetical protein
MKQMIINVNDLEQFMKLEKLSDQLSIKLHYFEEMQELQQAISILEKAGKE